MSIHCALPLMLIPSFGITLCCVSLHEAQKYAFSKCSILSWGFSIPPTQVTALMTQKVHLDCAFQLCLLCSVLGPLPLEETRLNAESRLWLGWGTGGECLYAHIGKLQFILIVFQVWKQWTKPLFLKEIVILMDTCIQKGLLPRPLWLLKFPRSRTWI